MKVGVFGGTFDPIHWGHLLLAEEARIAASLDRVIFVPAGIPPHKTARALTACSHRLEMVRLAIADSPEFELSGIESSGDGPHYSFETLNRLAAERPGDEISFILGSDSLMDLPGWRNPLALVDGYPLVVLPRPGFDATGMDPAFVSKAVAVTGISVSISSTLIRRRIREGQSVRFLLQPQVLDYARRNGLYRGD